MKRPSDEELILHYYGESADPATVEMALRDPETRRRWRELRAVLDAVPRQIDVPGRRDDFGERMWERVEARLDGGGRLLRFPSRKALARLAAAAAIAAAVGAAFWLGGRARGPAPGTVSAAGDARGTVEDGATRILFLAVSDHLDRTEMLLAELANREVDGGALEVDREWAEELSRSGRLYRRAAEESGAGGLALLLRELEPVLVELAHAPEALSPEELTELRERLDGGDLLFKVRVVGSRLKLETHPGAVGADV